MKVTIPTLAALSLLTASTFASADIRLSTDGVGDAVYVPMYTVNNDLSSLISVSNDSDVPSMVRVQFSESQNGQNVLLFNVYLPAHSVWSGALASEAGAGARLTSSSTVCTVPRITAQGFRTVPFEYANNFPDGGPTDVARTRNGAVEVIELGALTGQMGDLTTARNCAELEALYTVGSGGPVDRTGQILPPSKSISANALLIDVADGLIFRMPGIAVKGYSNTAQDPDFDGRVPRFANPILTGGDNFFITDTANGRLRFAADRGPDAMSSLFMSATLGGEIFTNADLGATTRWAVSFPTKAAYVSERPGSLATGGNPVAPFSSFFDADGSCDKVSTREGLVDGTALQTAEATTVDLCQQVNLIDYTRSSAETATRVLQFTDEPARSIQAQRLDGIPVVLRGMPAVGVQISNFVNGQLQGGVLANYSVAQPLRSSPALLVQ